MKEIYRRDFLKWAAMAGGGSLLAACSPSPEPTPTALPRPTARPTSEPVLTRAPEPTATLVPESPKLLERIEVDIPGLTVERYAVKFQEITDEVPESYKESAQKWAKWLDSYFYPEDVKSQPRPKPLIAGFSPIVCGPSFIDINEIRPSRGPEFFYFDGNSDRIYVKIVDDGKFRSQVFILMGEEDKKILNWQQEGVVSQYMDLSCDGKILYEVSDSIFFSTEVRHAKIIADISRGTKTVIRDINGRRFISDLTDDGTKLLLTAYPSVVTPEDADSKRGIYLVDLSNWRVQFHLPYPHFPYPAPPQDLPLLSEDGSLVYLPSGDRYVGVMHNTVTGEKTAINWPGIQSPYTDSPIASPNLRFMARRQSSDSMVCTPEGFFIIELSLSSWQKLNEYSRSISPWRIDDDGTLVTSKGILKFENGTYKLVKTRGGEPIEVIVTKVADIINTHRVCAR